jgi:hypothetical protein
MGKRANQRVQATRNSSRLTLAVRQGRRAQMPNSGQSFAV